MAFIAAYREAPFLPANEREKREREQERERERERVKGREISTETCLLKR